MGEINPAFIQFEHLVARLLSSMGHERVALNASVQSDPAGALREADIMFGPPMNETIVEVRYFRYSSPPTLDGLSRAMTAAEKTRRVAGAKKGILAASCPLGDYRPEFFKQWDSIEVWDGPKLLDLATEHDPAVSIELASLFEVDLGANAGPESPRRRKRIKLFENRGHFLAEVLENIPAGRATSTQFEDACISALRYLFETDLHGWHQQSSTEDYLHRRDLVCRIVSSADVWRLMLAELGSRYVVFEFKNYSDAITQQEVITTERYLYPAALRKVAIMISPKGCTESAQKVMDGAMREHGKLILSLEVEELVHWLIRKDGGTDPNTFLFERVDQFLMGLGR